MRTRVLIALVSIILGVLGASILVSAECPMCFNNVNQYQGRGLTNDGRKKLNVQVVTSGEGSWAAQGTTALNNIIAGADGARSDWNDQTTTGQPGAPHGTYFLQSDQAAAPSNVDIRIVLGTPSQGHDAETRGTPTGMGDYGAPFTITLPARAKDLSPNVLRAWIAHEIGHALGLSHSRDFNVCGHTIMNLLNNGSVITGSVQPQDIQQQRRQFGDQRSCEVPLREVEGLGNPTPTPTPTPTPPPGGGCVDQDNDGVCFFDDCDDHNPAVAWDSDGDHYCYPYDCDDYDSRVYPGAPLNYNTEGGEDRDCNGVDDLVQQFGSGGTGGGIPCTPYYWVYYESLDGGYTWEIIDISYAGCW